MIFISYSSKDELIASKINQAFKTKNIKTFFAKESIKAGDDYTKNIIRAIKNSKAIVLILSTNSNNSIHVQKELSLALKVGLFIIPINIDNIKELSESLEYLLEAIQYENVDPKDDSQIDNFINSVLAKIGLAIDNTKRISNKNIFEFCIKHFKNMGYKIFQDRWEQNKQIKAFKASHKDLESSLINYLKQNAFWVTKKNEEIIVIPKFLQNSSVSYFKAYEGEIYWEIRKFLGYEYMSDDNVSYKVKTNYVDAIRSKEKCLKVTFYLYVKNSPEFKKTRYRLPFYKSYQDGEDIGNLFINNSIHPNWIDVDSAEKVNSVIFKDFKSSFEKIKTDPNFYLTEEYEHYNGRIAETMAEVFFKRNGLFVQRHGVESLLGNSLSFIKKSEILEDENCLDTIKEYMSAPDLLIIKLNNKNELVNVYMMDVKWRKFANENELNQSLGDGGDLYYHSKKYDRYWERTYLFLIAIFQKDAKIYIIDNSKLDSKLIVPLDLDDNFSWLDKKEIEILNKEICKYWIK